MFDGIDSSDDWPVESVRRLEELLRCPICGEFLKHCVQLNGCSHTFCGVCIRKAYNERKRCPICHLQITGSFLTVSSIDSIVSQFQAARNDLLSLSRKVPTLNSTISDQGSLNSPLQNSYSLNSSPSPKPSPDKSSFKPLQSYVYSLMKPPQLKKLCHEHGLYITGSKDYLIKMHKRLVIEYNSQLSDPNPLTVQQVANSILSPQPLKQTRTVSDYTNVQSFSRLTRSKTHLTSPNSSPSPSFNSQPQPQAPQMDPIEDAINQYRERMKLKRQQQNEMNQILAINEQNWEMANQVVGNGHEETVAIIVDSDHEDPSNHELDGLAQLHSSDSDDTIAKVKHDEFTDDGWEDDGPQMRVHEPQAESHF